LVKYLERYGVLIKSKQSDSNMAQEEKSKLARLRTLKFIPKDERGVLIALIILLGVVVLCAITHSGRFTQNFLFYLLFFVLWPLCVFLVWIGFEVVKYLIVGAIALPGGFAVISYLNGHTEAALVAGAIAVGVLAVVLGIIVIIAAIFLGPAILVGLGIYYGLGSTFLAGLLGFIIGLIIYGLTWFLLRKIIIPFSFGFGATMLGGILASNVANLVFRIHQIYHLNLNIDKWFKEVTKSMDFSSIQSAIKSIYSALWSLLGEFRVGGWLIILGSFIVAIFFVIAELQDLKKDNT
jgi:hypothetical protein